MFEDRCNYPNYIDAIDDKHILIKAKHRCSYYLITKKAFSIVLLAIVNADYEFLYVYVGCNGK